MIKIAVVGSQCVGKTTFIGDVIAELPQFSRPEYTYRDAIKDAGIEGQINQKTCAASQQIVFDAIVKETQSSGKNVIHDRSVMDVLGHCMPHGVLLGRNSNTVPGRCNILVMAPPLILDHAEADTIIETIDSALESVF